MHAYIYTEWWCWWSWGGSTAKQACAVVGLEG
jgi:hypothetical protein